MSEENRNFEEQSISENAAEKKTAVSADDNSAYAEAGKYNALFSSSSESDEEKKEAQAFFVSKGKYENGGSVRKNAGENKGRVISLSAFVMSVIAIVLVTVMLTWTVCLGAYRKQLSDIVSGGLIGSDSSAAEIDLIASLLRHYSYFDLDEEEMLEMAVKAYVEATGDKYAFYMNEEEFENYNRSNTGTSVGVGITVIENILLLSGREYKTYKIVNVSKGSPAEEAGIHSGDIIAYIGIGRDKRESVDSMGYERAFAKMLGDEGTKAEFTVLRAKNDAEGQYEEIEFSIIRKKVVASSVYHHVCDIDNSVGIVKITGFNDNTPAQFVEAMDELKAQGIKKVVFDLRYNSGGMLVSIVAILSYFLDEGETILSTQSKGEEPKLIKVGVVNDLEGEKVSCNVSKEDIGKYKDFETAVICNELTASAAELFVATFRDYKLGKTVGTTTYGKGAMQSIFDLSYFGYKGGLKITTDMYFPPCGESYDGKGITPDVVVPLDEALYGKNIYDITDAEDNQIQAAIKTFQ